MFGGYHSETTGISKEMVEKHLNKECIKFHAQLGKLIKMSVLTFNLLMLILNLCLWYC